MSPGWKGGAADAYQQALARWCPRPDCGSAPHVPCLRLDGTPGKASPHRERYFDTPGVKDTPEPLEAPTATPSRTTSRPADPEAPIGTLWQGIFRLEIEPRSKGNSKGAPAVGVVVSRKGTRERQERVAELARPYAPPRPLLGSVRLSVTFVMPDRRRVDRGNLLKLIEDALEGDFYVDDSQIESGEVRKRLAFPTEGSGYEIVISGLLPEKEKTL